MITIHSIAILESATTTKMRSPLVHEQNWRVVARDGAEASEARATRREASEQLLVVVVRVQVVQQEHVGVFVVIHAYQIAQLHLLGEDLVQRLVVLIIVVLIK